MLAERERIARLGMKHNGLAKSHIRLIEKHNKLCKSVQLLSVACIGLNVLIFVNACEISKLKKELEEKENKEG